MRKVLFSFGLVILLASFILLGVGSIRNVNLEQLTSSTNSWQVSGNLMPGHTYVLDIHSSYQWRNDWDAHVGGYDYPQPVEVVMISPDGNESELLAFFYAVAPTSGSNYSVPGALPSFVQVEYKSVDHKSLSVDTTYPQARFTVISGGNYTARVNGQTINWTSGPPGEMIFEEEVVENPNSFTNLLEISGVACLVPGAVISVWGARASKKIRIKRNRGVKK